MNGRVEIDRDERVLSAEWVLVALLSVFALSSLTGIILWFAVIAAKTGITIFDLISEGFFIGPMKGSAYWLMGVGALWFIAHRLGFRQWWALVIIGATVNIGMTLVFSGLNFSLFWLVVNAVVSAIMGWVLWRLAYRSSVSNARAVRKLIPGAYQTTIGRALIALLFTGLLGGGFSAFILLSIFGGFSFIDFGEVFVFAIGFWLGGVFVFGGISIAVLHNIGLRQWYGLTIVGGLIMLLIGLVVLEDISDSESWVMLILLGIGCVTGWIIWRVAYRCAALEG